MSQSSDPSVRRAALFLAGLLIAVGIGVLIGWASFGGDGESDATVPESDEELVCAGLDQLSGHDDFESIIGDGIGPDIFRAIGVGHYAMAIGEQGDAWYDAGEALVEGGSRLDRERGDEGLQELRELCS